MLDEAKKYSKGTSDGLLGKQGGLFLLIWRRKPSHAQQWQEIRNRQQLMMSGELPLKTPVAYGRPLRNLQAPLSCSTMSCHKVR